jgi:hypothetical protein
MRYIIRAESFKRFLQIESDIERFVSVNGRLPRSRLLVVIDPPPELIAYLDEKKIRYHSEVEVTDKDNSQVVRNRASF